MFILKKSPVEGERVMNFSFSSYSENYQDPGIGKWCWWRKAPVQVCLPQVRTRSEDDGDGCTVPRCPQRFRQPLLHEASVLWAVFPTILRAYYPRKVEWKRQQQTGHGNWTGTLVQRPGAWLSIGKDVIHPCHPPPPPCFLSLFTHERLWTQWTLQMWPWSTGCSLLWAGCAFLMNMIRKMRWS